MTGLAIPLSVSNKRWIPWAAGGAVALVAMLVFWAVTRPSTTGGTPTAGKFVTLTSGDMDVKVTKDGELQATNNIDIVNRVEGQSTIVEIVKEGANVKKGDVLVLIDSSKIRQDLEDAKLALQKAESDLKTAKELQRIQENQNAADIEVAEVDLELAKLALREYSEGTYPEALANAQTALKMAVITVKNKEEELEQTRTLFSKGFVTAAQVKADELSVTTVTNDRRKAETALKVLTEFTYASAVAGKRSTLSQSEQKLARVQITGTSTLQQKMVAVQAAEAALTTAKRKLDYLTEQLAFCTIVAPADGMVVYAQSDRNAQNAIAEGTTIRERQQLLRLPDTKEMKVIVRANESQVSRLQVGQQAVVKIVGIPDPLRATVTKKSPIADSGQRFWNPDLKEYPIELTLDKTPGGVLPGMGAAADIFVERLHSVVAVPLSAIYSERTSSYVFVRQGDEIVPKPVKIGLTNETHARIDEAVAAGSEVLILEAGQGRDLLEKAGIQPPPEHDADQHEVDDAPPVKTAEKKLTPPAPNAQSTTKPAGANAKAE